MPGTQESRTDDLRAVFELHGCKIKSGPKRCWKHRPGLTHQLDLGERGLAVKATSVRPANGTRIEPFYEPLDRLLQNSAKQIMLRAAHAGRDYKSITVASLAARFSSLGYECVWCGGPFECVDHVVASAIGGSDELSNLVPACRDCNSRKGDLEIGRWLDGEEQQSRAGCGTATAYRRHIRHKEQPCDACRAAQREYIRSKGYKRNA